MDDDIETWVWIAFYVDWSDFAIFAQELTALRHAVENHMEAMRVPTGVSVHEYVSAEWKKQVEGEASDHARA